MRRTVPPETTSRLDEFLAFVRRKGVHLFLDSGAFAVAQRGATLDLQEYIDFIKRNRDQFDVYTNLDVIGDAEATWRNQKIMEDAGLSPIPVYHATEPIEYLHRCLEYPYIGLGGIAVARAATKSAFLDRCFSIICDSPNRLPRSKVHGFGVTSFVHMTRYPWFSVDSTTWTFVSGNGNIYVPRRSPHGEWRYVEGPYQVKVKTVAGAEARKLMKVPFAGGGHFEELSPVKRQLVLDYLRDSGFPFGRSSFKVVDGKYRLRDGEKWATRPEDRKTLRKPQVVEIVEDVGVCNDWTLRLQLNARFFVEMEKQMPKWPWPFDVRRTVVNSLGIVA